MESDLYALLQVNIVFKYAVDTNFLVPERADVSLAVEFSHIKTWVDSNGLITNLGKTKELVLHRLHCNKHDLPQSLEGTEPVQTEKLLGVIFQSSFSFCKSC